MSKSRIIKLLATFAIIFIVSMSININSNAAGWAKKNGHWTYSDQNGIVRSRWMFLNMNWYFFDKNGYMATGLKKINGHTYYFTPTTKGAWRQGMRTIGWQLIDGQYRYFNSAGQYVPDNHLEAGSIKGIDVSMYQGSMNWTAVKNQGIQFTFIRVGHGNHNIDPYFQRNMISAHANGIKTGVYFYSTATSPQQSRSDAQWVIRQLRGYTVDFPVALDMEDNSVAPLGSPYITTIAKAFLDEIRAAGYTPMVYCNENWAINFIDLDRLPGVYRWIARFNGTYNEAIHRDIWQAGSTTLLDGIDVNSVDIDFCYRDFSKIVKPRRTAIKSYSKKLKGFHKSEMGIWYDNGDGTYPANEWKRINDKTYLFDEMGYLVTSTWKYTSSGVYYVGKNGYRAENAWMTKDGKRYFFRADGCMATGCIK